MRQRYLSSFIDEEVLAAQGLQVQGRQVLAGEVIIEVGRRNDDHVIEQLQEARPPLSIGRGSTIPAHSGIWLAPMRSAPPDRGR